MHAEGVQGLARKVRMSDPLAAEGGEGVAHADFL